MIKEPVVILANGDYPTHTIPMQKINDALQALLDGGQGQNRTVDTRIFSPLLYRLSYLAFVIS